MVLVALPGSVTIGHIHRHGFTGAATFGNMLVDALNEAIIMVGRVITEDGSSHTIDTTGSSSFGWRTGAVTFSNAGTTVKIGLSTPLASSGPPSMATNISDVITFDVNGSLVGGGGGVTANAWQTTVPTTGTKTIANGDLVAFCVQMTARGGTDSVQIQAPSGLATVLRPSITGFLGGAYTDLVRLPNVLITFSDGLLGWIEGGYVASIGSTTQTWNSGSGTKEYGNFLQLPFPTRIYGIAASIACTNSNSDVDLVLYTDPLGTPTSQRSASIDANIIPAVGNNGLVFERFSSPYDLSANTPVAVVVKPVSINDVSMGYLTLSSSTHQKAWQLAVNGYAINRNTGVFAAQNASRDRFAIGLICGAFDAGGGGRAIQVNDDSLVA